MADLPTGEPCHIFETIDSTNEEARRLAHSGERGPLWVRADRQTGGRGRRGRNWVSEPGNLFATCLLSPGRPQSERAQLSFVAALALHDALAKVSGLGDRIRCKWPNDLKLEGGKLAGILLESEHDWVAVGIGVNLAHAPDNVDRHAVALSDICGKVVPPEALLQALASAFQARRRLWEAEGFQPIRAEWLARAEGLGEPLIARLHDKDLSGVFSDLAYDGALLLELPDRSVARITAGDIFPLSAGAR